MILVSWHLGDRADVTLRALDVVKNTRVLVVEDIETTRAQLSRDYRFEVASKLFLQVPFARDPALLDQCRKLLAREDVAMLASSGAPCFVDPGAWLVHDLRVAGTPIVAHAGVSALATVMALSGEEWSMEAQGFTFRLVARGKTADVASLLRERKEEPFVLFLAPEDARAVIAHVAAIDGARSITFFCDLTKDPAQARLADHVETASAVAWQDKAEQFPWSEVADLAAVIHGRRR